MTTDAAVGDRVRLDTQGTARPLAEAQAGMWYAQRLDPANPVFNTAQYIEIAGTFDVAAFRAAVRDAMAEADALAMRVIEAGESHDAREAGGEPRQILDETRRAALDLTVVDLRAEQDPGLAAEARMQADLGRPLDPAVDPFAAQMLFVLAEDRHLWYQRIHHLAIDGYGTVLLTARICDLYSSRVTGSVPATQPFGAFASVLDADAQYRASTKREEDKAWWLRQFDGAPAVAGLTPGAAITAHHYLHTALDLPAGTGDALRRAAEAADVPWPDVVTALVAAYVARHAGEDAGKPVNGADRGVREVTLGVAAMERLGTPAARVPAMVMNVLPVRIPVDEDQPLPEWFDRVSRVLKQARRRGRYRSEQLRRDLGLLGGGKRLHGPLVNVLPFDAPPRIAGVDARLHVLATGPVDDLTVTIRADASMQHVRAELDANPNLYGEAALSAHAARLAAFFERALSATRLLDVPTLTSAEHTRWAVEVNDTAHDVERTTLTALIERTVARTPDAPAVVFGTRQLSFADLYDLSGHLAATLRDRGVRRGDIVGVMLPRSIELVATLYAILRVGAAYLPLDPDQPAARLSPMVSLAEPRCVVVDAGAAARLPTGTKTVFLDELLTDSWTDAARGEARGAIEAMAPEPDDRAYVIFTSGSTGEPKGVVIEHHAIVNRLEWMRAHYGVDPGDRILQKTPYTFDVSVWEFFLPLIAGATLVVAPPGIHKDPRGLIDLMRSQRVSVVHFVPSMLAELLAELQPESQSVLQSEVLAEPDANSAGFSPRMVFCSGEALPAALRDRFHAAMADVELHNLYGPTEAAVDVTYWPASAADRSDPVPIGHPVWNTRLYILDDRQRPVPPGVAGHLLIGGVQLAREYVARPALTRERFIADPFGAPGDRLYRTGDIARWRGDGAIEFLGRADHQVKIRGQRIELGEIETAIVATGLTPRAVVIARQDVPGDPRLVAYVEAPAGASASGAEADGRLAEPAARLDEIAAEIAARLPGVMIPAAFVAIAEWPVTANGKLDRARLPEPAPPSRTKGRETTTATEQRVAALFANVLHLEPAGIDADSDFFALGGHSLLATQLIRKLRAAFAREISLGAIFAHPTVARLAAHVDGASRAAGDGLDVLLPLHVPQRISAATGAATAPAVMTPAAIGRVETELVAAGRRDADQEVEAAATEPAALACVHPAGGIAWCYGNLARALTPTRPVYGLQARSLRPGAPLPSSLDALAADYAAELRRVQPHGPYHLLGWSVGGIIAQAMAVHLEDAGERVGLLAALDAYPSDRWRSATDPDEAAALRALLLMAGEEPEAVAARASQSADSARGESVLTRAIVVDTLRRGHHPLGALSDDTLTGVLRVVEHNNRLVRRHVHRRCAARMVHFKASLDATASVTSADEWSAYADGLYRVDVPFIHAHMTSPDASRLIAPILAEHMR